MLGMPKPVQEILVKKGREPLERLGQTQQITHEGGQMGPPQATPSTLRPSPCKPCLPPMDGGPGNEDMEGMAETTGIAAAAMSAGASAAAVSGVMPVAVCSGREMASGERELAADDARAPAGRMSTVVLRFFLGPGCGLPDLDLRLDRRDLDLDLDLRRSPLLSLSLSLRRSFPLSRSRPLSLPPFPRSSRRPRSPSPANALWSDQKPARRSVHSEEEKKKHIPTDSQTPPRIAVVLRHFFAQPETKADARWG